MLRHFILILSGFAWIIYGLYIHNWIPAVFGSFLLSTGFAGLDTQLLEDRVELLRKDVKRLSCKIAELKVNHILFSQFANFLQKVQEDE